MDTILLNDAARAVHLVGLAMGFGVAIIADLTAARSLTRPLDERALATLHRFHRLVTVGLLLLWASGAVLLWLRTGFDPARFSPKLLAKIGVVTLLTVNAIAIGRIGLPTMEAYQSWRFGDIPLTERVQLSCLGALSGACWLLALALGVFSQLKPMPWEVLSRVVGIVGAMALVLAIMAAVMAPFVAFFARRLQRRAALAGLRRT